MEFKQVIARLNTLYHKSKLIGLTAAELAERDELRRVYLDSIKQQLRSTLDRIEVVDGANASGSCGCDCDCGHHHH